MNKISVIIPTLGRPHELSCCMDSIVNQTLLPSEVIIVDQSPDDRTKNLVSTYQQKFSAALSFVYLHQSERSSARARNNGASMAKGEIISFTDDDIVLYPDYFEKIMAGFEDPQVGGVMGNVENPLYILGVKGFLRKALLRLFLLNNFDGKMTPSGFGYPIFERKITKVEEVELFPGYSMNFKRELFLAEQFDNWFSGYSFREDVDLTYRISRKAKMIMAPDARFEHNHSKVGRNDVQTLKMMQYKNYKYVFHKLKDTGPLSKCLFYYSLFGIVFMEFVEFLFGFRTEKRENFQASVRALKVCLTQKS